MASNEFRRRPTRSPGFIKSAGCLLLVLFWFCSGADAANKVRISVTNYNMSYLAAGVAAKKGFFKEEGLDPEIIRMNFNVAMSALINGEVDLHDDIRLRGARCHERNSGQGGGGFDR